MSEINEANLKEFAKPANIGYTRDYIPNLHQAPRVFHNGDINTGSYRTTADGKEHAVFYKLPHELTNVVLRNMSGKNGNQIKLMMVLIGSNGDGNFALSEYEVKKRTGMRHKEYSNARKALVEKGWITHNKGELIVNIDNIFNSDTYYG